MKKTEVIVEKMIKMSSYLRQLSEIKPNSFEEYENNMTIKYASERIMQLIIDLALDINNILLSYYEKPPASDYFNSFVDLVECNVLSREFALDIAPSTGLRNRLVHEYEEINNKIVFESIDKMIDKYTQYMIKINDFI